MKTKELSEKTLNDLKKLLIKEREAVRTARFEVIAKKEKNHQSIGNAKKNIARILTVINEKQAKK